ncbi:MAG: hypothetical protein IPM59_12035 [Chloracidobacterium sp.]|nr:hypothetical protein [Chloracidobacterium sp.]
MSVKETIRFAQENFGSSEGLPDGHERSPVPDWLDGRAENAFPIDPADDIEIETDDGDGLVGNADKSVFPVIDSLAYYLPFHFYKSDWGIYIRAFGIQRLACELASPRRPVGVTALKSAFRILLEHERMHFLCELAASRIEVVVSNATYSPYFRDKSAGEHEEAIANAAALMKSGTRDAQLKAAHDFMKRQGSGYSDFDQWLDVKFPIGKRTAVSNMLALNNYSNRPGEFLLDLGERYSPPMYIVIDQPAPWLRVIKPFREDHGLQVFVHAGNEHKPPHCPAPCFYPRWKASVFGLTAVGS